VRSKETLTVAVAWILVAVITAIVITITQPLYPDTATTTSRTWNGAGITRQVSYNIVTMSYSTDACYNDVQKVSDVRPLW